MAQLSVSTISLNGVATRWCESGDGTLGQVLLVHSLGLDCLSYGGLRDALAPGWRLSCYDQRGHGASCGHVPFSFDQLAGDALSALERMDGGGQVHLVGHSMGGAVAAVAAARSRVVSLSLVATPATGIGAFRERAEIIESGGFQHIAETTLKRWFEGDPESVTKAFARSVASLALMAIAPASLAAAWRALASFDGESAYGNELPSTLCIAAAGDASTPPQAMQAILDTQARTNHASNIRLETIAAAGHMVPLTRPDSVAALLAAHWVLSKRPSRPVKQPGDKK